MMYPELYPELEGRSRMLRGFALSLAGSFIFMVTTVAAVALSSQWLYAAVSGLSLGAVGLIFAHRSRPNWKNKYDFEKKSSGERAINMHPGFLDDSEAYSMLMLTTETESGVEIASFEVQDPQAPELSIKNHIAKSTS